MKLLIFSILLFPLFSFANDIAEEPQILIPSKDQKLISSFHLNQNWNEPVINILLVGQDGQQELPFPFIHRENGEQTRRLSSRADATVLLSFNRLTGKTTLFSLERNNIDISDHNEILTHQYILKGRAYYLQLVKDRTQKLIKQLHKENQFLAADQTLHVHGLVELDFLAFRNILAQFRDNLVSSAQMAWALKAHSFELLNLLKDENSVLRRLRARKNFASGSYQRTLTHGLFLSSILGILSYTLVESNEKNFLNEEFLYRVFNELSRTFSLNDLVSHLKMKDPERSVLQKAGFSNGQSTVDVYLLGVDPESYASYSQGELKINVTEAAKKTTDQLMLYLDVNAGQFLKAKDCETCK